MQNTPGSHANQRLSMTEIDTASYPAGIRLAIRHPTSGLYFGGFDMDFNTLWVPADRACTWPARQYSHVMCQIHLLHKAGQYPADK